MNTDLVGHEFGDLKVLWRSERRSKCRAIYWLCFCDCGLETEVKGSDLRSGVRTDCGCRGKQSGIKKHTTHGASKTSEYRTWLSIRNRCKKNFTYYGTKGITVCEEWANSFEAFIKDVGPKPSKLHTLDRKDSSLGYNADNCRWATTSEQNNNLSSNKLIEFDGKIKTLAAWAKEYGLKPGTVNYRLISGMSVDLALTKPVDERFKPKTTRTRKAKTAEQIAWVAMKARCKNSPTYKEKNITVCERWANSFNNFLDDMGSKPSSKHSLERKNNSLGYNHDNCVWATATEQNNNNGNNRYLTHNNKTQTVSRWSRELNISVSVLYGRLSVGWSVDRTLSTPKLRHNRMKVL